MKVTNINLDRLLSLDAIDCEVNEGFIYRYNGMIAKLFATSLTDEDLEFIKNKMYSCSLLDRYKSLLPKEYVVASSALAVDGTELGITEEEIIGRTYKEIFNDETIPLEKKIKMLKKVGKLFNDMDVIRTNGLENLHIGDVHSGNFMLDRFGNLKVVDTDSSTIFDSPAYPAKYLCEGSVARLKPTYKYTKDGILIPCRDSDLHGYHMMIMEMLFDDEIDYDDEIYFHYLDHLKRSGASKELTDSFDRLITPERNTNPVDYLDTINEKVYNNCKKLII